MPKIAIVVGTRPEAIKMAPVYLDLKKKLGEHCVEIISTGQHRELLWQCTPLFRYSAIS